MLPVLLMLANCWFTSVIGLVMMFAGKFVITDRSYYDSDIPEYRNMCPQIPLCRKGRFKRITSSNSKGNNDKGGQASVQILKDTETSTPVLRKHFHIPEDFDLEVSALSCLQHSPLIIRPICIDQNGLDVVMEYAPDGDFTDQRLYNSKMEYEDAVMIAAQVIAAIAAVHRAGILHGDIKPENFVFKGQRLHLIDFGLTRRLGVHEIIDEGTPQTMSPEVAFTFDGRTQLVQEALDWWSVGVTLHYFFARYFNDNPAIINDDIFFPYRIHWDPQSPSIISRFEFPQSYPRQFPADLVDFLQLLLQFDPDRRNFLTGRSLQQSLLEHPLFSSVDWMQIDPNLFI